MMSALEDLLASLESRVQMIVMRYTQLNEENQNLLSRIDELSKQNLKKDEDIAILRKEKEDYLNVRENIRKKIEDLISNLMLDFDKGELDVEGEILDEGKDSLSDGGGEDNLFFDDKIFSNSSIKFAVDDGDN